MRERWGYEGTLGLWGNVGVMREHWSPDRVNLAQHGSPGEE